MRVDLAVIADAANTTAEGKLNVLGIFGAIRAPELPWRHPQLYLVIRFRGDAADQGQTKQLAIQMRNADGQLLIGMESELVVPPDAGVRQQFDNIIGISGVVFPAAGAYEFLVTINGQTDARIPIEVVHTPQLEA